MTAPGLERKVRQLDNDVQSIYEMLSAIQGTQLRHGNRLDELDERLSGLDDRLGRVEEQVTGIATDMTTALELLRAR